eukprot:m.152451 g.152451  ORF g.152451 m.152451 type:complete len:859 (+) comp13302_c0_seq1:185-2761(+)
MSDFFRRTSSYMRRKALGKIFEEKKEGEEEEETEAEGVEGEETYNSSCRAGDDEEQHEEDEDEVDDGNEEGDGSDEDNTDGDEEYFSDEGDTSNEASSVVINDNSNNEDVVVSSSSSFQNRSNRNNGNINDNMMKNRSNNKNKVTEECGDSGICSNGNKATRNERGNHNSNRDNGVSEETIIAEQELTTNDGPPPAPFDRERTPSPSTFATSVRKVAPKHQTMSTTTSTPSLGHGRGRGRGKKHQRSVSDVVGYDYILGHTNEPSDDSDDSNSGHINGSTHNNSSSSNRGSGSYKQRGHGSVDFSNTHGSGRSHNGLRFELGDTTGYEDSYDEEDVHEGEDEEEEEDDEMESLLPQMEGVLAKWTNYFHGWQERYFVLQKGNLSYFKSKEHTTKVCRGTMDLSHAKVTPHPYDVLRFDVVLHDQAFCIRTTSTAERAEWVLAMKESKKLQTGGELSRHPSTLSLTSIASGNSNHLYGPQSVYRTITDKYAESRALHEAFMNQIEEMNLRLIEGSNHRDVHRQKALLKSTSSGLIRSLKEWMDLMVKREDEWKRKYDRANEKRRRAVEELRALKEERGPTMLGPDMEEGPHSTMNEDEFFDALEIGLDQLDAEEEQTRRERELEEKRDAIKLEDDSPPHRFNAFIEENLQKNLELALESVDKIWQLTHEENAMKVYSRESNDTDQQKCFHFIKGITAKELCMFYWDGKIRLEWEHTIEKLFFLEWLDKSTCIQHNIHKRVWPTAQRDSCILSHLRRLDDNTWVVQNKSVEHDDAPSDKFVRLSANILMHATTTYPDDIPRDQLTRSDVGTNIIFLCYIHPGGWAPKSVVKAVARREYPKFLKNIEQHSLKFYNNKPIML